MRRACWGEQAERWKSALSCLHMACGMDPLDARKLLRRGVAHRCCGDLGAAVGDLQVSQAYAAIAIARMTGDRTARVVCVFTWHTSIRARRR